MTSAEIRAEWTVIYETRLGVLCGSGRPTREQVRIARDEADRWEARQLSEEDIEAVRKETKQ